MIGFFKKTTFLSVQIDFSAAQDTDYALHLWNHSELSVAVKGDTWNHSSTVLCNQNFEPWDDTLTALELNIPLFSVWH